MLTFKMHSISFHTAYAFTHIDLELYTEDKLFFQKKVYESGRIKTQNQETDIIVNEIVQMVVPTKEIFFKFVVNLCLNNDSDTHRFSPVQSFTHYSLLPDLTNPLGVLTIADADNCFRLKYEIQTDCEKRFCDEKEFAVADKEKEKSSMMEMLTITNKFLKKITPLRRFQADIEYSLAQKNLVLDFAILLYFLGLIHYGNQIILGTFVFFIFSKLKYKLRFMLVEKSIGYFYREDDAREVKKNLEFIKKQQLMILEFLTKIKRLVYFKNRKLLYFLFTFGFAGTFIGVIFLYNSTLSLNLTLFFVSLFFGRYIDELSIYIYTIKSLFDKIGHCIKEKKDRVCKRIQNYAVKFNYPGKRNNELWKVRYLYEHKRYFVNVGWANSVFGGSFIKSRTNFL